MSKYARDKKFFIENIAPMEDAIYRYLLGKVDDRSLVEDLAQNTMEKAWKNLSQLREGDKARSWLFCIAKNEVTSYYRKYETIEYYDENAEEDGLVAEQIEREQADVLECLIHDFDVYTMRKALQQLEPKCRKLIVMHYYQGMNQREIADLLGENRSTVRVNMVRALEKLKMLVDEIEKEVR